MSESYKAFVSDDKESLKHVEITPLFLFLLNPSFDESIQDFVTNLSISSKAYIQLGLTVLIL